MAQDRQFVAEWRNAVGPTRFPFADGARLVTADGLALDKGALVDALVLVPGPAGRAYLDSVVTAAGAATLTVGDGLTRARAAVTFDPLACPAVLALTDPAGRPAGCLVPDPAAIAALGAWPPGTHRFNPDDAELAASCVFGLPEVGVTAFLLDDGAVLSGDVWLVGEDGIFLSNPEPEVVRVDVVGDPLWRRKQCEPASLFTTPNPVRTINGIPPDGFGRFYLTPGTGLTPAPVLRITPADGALRIELVGRRADGG